MSVRLNIQPLQTLDVETDVHDIHVNEYEHYEKCYLVEHTLSEAVGIPSDDLKPLWVLMDEIIEFREVMKSIDAILSDGAAAPVEDLRKIESNLQQIMDRFMKEGEKKSLLGTLLDRVRGFLTKKFDIEKGITIGEFVKFVWDITKVAGPILLGILIG